jgi:hypothetical protein
LSGFVRLAGLAAVFSSALLIASCGGGGGSSSPSPTATPTTAPTSTPTSAPTSTPTGTPTATPSPAATTAPLSATVSFATVGAYGLSLTFSPPPSPAGVVVNAVSYSGAPPTAVPTNAPGAQPSPAAGTTPTVVSSFTFQIPAGQPAVTVPSPRQAFVGLAAPAAGTNYYTYFADITAKTSNGYSGPLTYAGGSAVEPPSGSGATLTPGDVYVVELVNF